MEKYFNYFGLYLLMLLIGCAIEKNIPVKRVEIEIYEYKYKMEKNIYPIFYKFDVKGTIENYECKVKNSRGTCYYADTMLLNWLCNSEHLEEFKYNKYNPYDSLSYNYDGYDCFFREPFRIELFKISRRKDTIIVFKNNIVNSAADIPPDEYGYKYYQRIILDSMVFNYYDDVFVFKEEKLREVNNIVLLQDNTTLKIYYISRKHILFQEKELVIFDNQHYITIRDFVRNNKCICIPQ